MPAANTAIESRIDAVLAREQSTRDEQARATVRARVLEEDRLAQLAKEDFERRMAHAAYLERAAAMHPQAGAAYKAATDTWRDARIKLQALDTILGRTGFSAHNLGVEL